MGLLPCSGTWTTNMQKHNWTSARKWREGLYSLLCGENVTNDISEEAERGSNKTCNDDCHEKREQKKLFDWTLSEVY